MATTTSGNLKLVTEILQPALAGAFAGMKIMLGSGVAAINSSMPGTKGGKKITVPYFGTLGEFQTVSAEGDGVVPATLSETSEDATIVHKALGFEETMFAALVQDPASDAYKEAAKQIAEAAERAADQMLIDVASASLPAMTKDVYSAGAPRTLDYDLMVDGKMLWGDEQSDIAALGVHSKVFGDMMKLKTADGLPLLTAPSDGGLFRFLGIPVLVSDRLAPDASSPAKYTTLVMKKNALVFWYNGAPRVLTDTDVQADTQLVFAHMYCVAYRYNRLASRTKAGIVLLKHN